MTYVVTLSSYSYTYSSVDRSACPVGVPFTNCRLLCSYLGFCISLYEIAAAGKLASSAVLLKSEALESEALESEAFTPEGVWGHGPGDLGPLSIFGW